MQPYDSVLVAKYLLALARRKNIDLNVTKVQKLLFLVYSYFLTNKGIVIIAEEPQAWPFGPVFPKAREKGVFEKAWSIDDKAFDTIRRDKDLTEALEYTISQMKDFSATQLSEWSCDAGSPWDRTTRQKGFEWSDRIPNEYIIDYFKPMINAYGRQ